MKFNDHLKIVRNCENESDLSHEWIKSIIASQDHKKSLKLRWEKKNQNGRLDLALGFEGREVCIVELKSPTVENIEDFRIQLHRYIYAQNFWRHGSLNPALGILTNGKKAILMDGRKDFLSATKTSVILNLEDEKEFLEFKNIIKRLSWGERGHKTHSAVETDNRENAVDVIDKLTTELLNYYNRLSTIKNVDPFSATLQIFLIAVLRDTGYIPTSLMQKCYESEQWSELTRELNSILSTNFPKLPNKEKLIEMVYQETRTLSARLDVVPPDCLGLVYEKLLHKISKNDAVTSYYTPYDMALEVIKKLDIDENSRVVDPSCGSGTFLTAVVDYVYSKSSKHTTESVFNFITNNVHGIDRDIFACQVTKAMLLAAAAQHCNIDPAKRTIRFPSLKDTIINQDFFLYEKKFKPTHVVGNAPWGGVDDNKKKEAILPGKVRAASKITEKGNPVYFRNVDVSCLFLYQITETFPKAKIGLLIKQQALHNDGSQKFLPWAEKEEFTLYDYGDREFFNNPSSLTAIAYKGTNDQSFIKFKGVKYPKISNELVPLNQKFHFFEAFEANRANIFIDVAARLIKKGKKLDFIKPMYPTYNDSVNLKMPSKLTQICFIPNGITPPEEFVNELTDAEKKLLKTRVQVSKNYQFCYRGTEGFKYYNFDTPNGLRIVMPMSFNPIRAYAMLDKTGAGIPIKDHSCVLIPKEGTTVDEVYSMLGWLNSRYFYFECLRSKVKRLSGGRLKFQGKQKNLICIPEQLLTQAFSTYVKTIMKKKITPKVLAALDKKVLDLCHNKEFDSELKILIQGEKLLKTVNIAINKSESKKGKKAA